MPHFLPRFGLKGKLRANPPVADQSKSVARPNPVLRQSSQQSSQQDIKQTDHLKDRANTPADNKIHETEPATETWKTGIGKPRPMPELEAPSAVSAETVDDKLSTSTNDLASDSELSSRRKNALKRFKDVTEKLQKVAPEENSKYHITEAAGLGQTNAQSKSVESIGGKIEDMVDELIQYRSDIGNTNTAGIGKELRNGFKKSFPVIKTGLDIAAVDAFAFLADIRIAVCSKSLWTRSKRTLMCLTGNDISIWLKPLDSIQHKYSMR